MLENAKTILRLFLKPLRMAIIEERNKTFQQTLAGCGKKWNTRKFTLERKNLSKLEKILKMNYICMCSLLFRIQKYLLTKS